MKKRFLSILLAACMVFAMLPMPALATEPGTQAYDPAEYDPNDVAVINDIIKNNKLNATPNAPADWETALLVTWDGSTPKRVKSLGIASQKLKDTLNVSGLTELTSLNCKSNNLTALNVSGLTKLTLLRCNSNQLTTLDVSGLKSLETLSCFLNQLTELKGLDSLANLTELHCYTTGLKNLEGLSSLGNLTILNCFGSRLETLDVSGLENLTHLDCHNNSQLTALDGLENLTNLQSLTCYNNRLTTLDVSNLSSLTALDCYNNPLASLKLSGNLSLTVPAVAGGRVDLTAYNHSAKSVAMRAWPEHGVSFQKWTAEGGTLEDETANPVTFTLNGNITLTPVFASSLPTPTVSERYIYANGAPLLLVEGTTEGYTVVYLDKNDNGEIDGGDEIFKPGDSADGTTAGNDLSKWTIYGGSESTDLTANPKITMLGGKVSAITGGNDLGGTINGSTAVNVTGGTVLYTVTGGNRNNGVISGSAAVSITNGATVQVVSGGNGLGGTVGSVSVTIENAMVVSGVAAGCGAAGNKRTLTVGGSANISGSLGYISLKKGASDTDDGFPSFAISSPLTGSIILSLKNFDAGDTIATGARKEDLTRLALVSSIQDKALYLEGSEIKLKELHQHDMSVDCGQTDPVIFEHALTCKYGALYIDGAAAEKTSSGYLLPGGNYYLAEDLIFNNDGIATSDSTVNLCLNGHKLARTGTSQGGGAINSLQGTTLNLCDCDGSHGSHKITSPVTGEEVTISGGLITGSTISGIYMNPDTALNLYGGTVAGNGAEAKFVGGVYNLGIFHMYGGTISHNLGIYGGVMGGTFLMSGGSITNNRGEEDCGGGISTPTTTLSGSPIVSGNVAGEQKIPSNLCLNPFTTVAIGENFAPENPIGVTTKTSPTVQAPVPITQAGSKDYSQYFASDNNKYAVENSGEGENQIVQLVYVAPDFEGEGTKDSPYVLNSYADLEKLAQKVNNGKGYSGEYFQLPENFPTDGALTTSIGTESNPFQGTFDGNGQTIRLDIHTSEECQGLFGFVEGSSTARAKIQNVIVSGTVSAGGLVGGVAGIAQYCDVTNCANTAQIVSGQETTGYLVGGVVGTLYNATIKYCYNTGSVTGDYSDDSQIGGIVGNSFGGTVEHCYNIGAVSGHDEVGGIVGSILSSQLTGCRSLGLSVTASGASAGRVVGANDGTITGCSAREDMTLTVNGAVQAVTDGKAGNKNGADLKLDGATTISDAFTDWNPEQAADVWNIPDGDLIPGCNLPTLLSAPQSPAPVLPAPIVVTLPDGSTVQCGLEDALAAVQNHPGSTLKLMNGVTGSQECDTGRFTIDLNGHTWNGGLTLSGSADVTILDSVGGGSILGEDGDGHNAANAAGRSAVELAFDSTASLTLAGNEPYTLQGGNGVLWTNNQKYIAAGGGHGVYTRKGSTLTVENAQVLLRGGNGGAGGESASGGTGGAGCAVESAAFTIPCGLFQGGAGGTGQIPGVGGSGLILSSATALLLLSGVSATGGPGGDNTAAKQGTGLEVSRNPVTVESGTFQGNPGILVDNTELTVIDADVSGNTGLWALFGSTANISGGTFTGNHGPGLSIANGGSATLSGGTFTGTEGGFAIDSASSSATLLELLKPGFSYYQDGAEITDDATLGGNQLAENGTAAVAPAGETFYAISGTVQDSSANKISGADVSLMRGKETLARTTSAGDGTYSFPTVKPGTYNVVAQKDANIKTILVIVTEENQTNQTIQFPADSRNSVVEVQGQDTPPAVVGGLDSVAETQDANTTVKLTVKKVETPADAQDIKTEAKNQQLLFLDLALVKITTAQTTPITDTQQKVLEIVVPYDTKQTGVAVYRKHGNDPAEKLTALDAKPDTPADGSYWAEEASGLLHIYASKFSTYAIGYDRRGGGSSSTAEPVLPFTDVKDTDWYREAVGYMYQNGLMEGTSQDRFSPNLDTSRGMIVTILWRLESQPESAADLAFTDVKTGSYYEKAVRWAAEQGIVKGYTETEFGPENPVARQELAAILHRYAEYKGQDVSATSDLSQFTDQPSGWARENVQWAVGEGLLTGKGGGKLDPQGRATRAETAAMLMRFLSGFHQ